MRLLLKFISLKIYLFAAIPYYRLKNATIEQKDKKGKTLKNMRVNTSSVI